MAISFIGSSVGTTTADMPAHVAGDLIIVFAYADSAAVQPTLPAGFANIIAGSGNSNGQRVGYKVAASSSETVGTWANATQLAICVYRGTHPTSPIGASAQFTNVADVTYPAITLADASGSSWVYAAHGRRTGNSENVAVPAGTALRADTGSSNSGRVVSIDSNGGVTSWPSMPSGGSNTFRYRSVSIEIKAAATSPAPIAGSLARTLGQLTAAGASKVSIRGQSGRSLGALTSIASAKLANAGSLVRTLGAVTLSATSMLPGTGIVTRTLDAVTSLANGSSPRKAQLAKTLSPLTASGTGRQETHAAEGRVSGQLGSASSSSTARIAIRGVVGNILDGIQVFATGRRVNDVATPPIRTITLYERGRTLKMQTQDRTVRA